MKYHECRSKRWARWFLSRPRGWIYITYLLEFTSNSGLSLFMAGKKQRKREQKIEIVRLCEEAARANPAVVATLSAAQSATALRNAVRRVLGKAAPTNFLDNSMNMRDVAVALAHRLGNEELRSSVMTIYGEKSMERQPWADF